MRAILLLVLFNISAAFAQLPGDFNCNGQVNGVDLVAFSTSLHDILNPIDTSNCQWHNGDYNEDGKLYTLADYGQLRWYVLGEQPRDFIPRPGVLDSIVIGNGRGNPGGDVYLPIYLVNADTMADFEINIQYYSSYLHAPDIIFAPGYNYFEMKNDTLAFIIGNSQDTIPPGRYWIANLRFSLPPDIPAGATIDVGLNSGAYFPSGFISLSYPTFFIAPTLIPGQIWVNPSGVDDFPIPEKLSLNIYPNPFNSQANIEFTLANESNVRIEILDLLGRVIDTPIDGRYAAGNYSAIWNATERSSGVYFCRFRTDTSEFNRRLTLLK
jgi:hypothetical protein